MRICVFIRSMPAVIKGGMENHTLLLATMLAKKGHDVTILTTSHPRGLEYENIEGAKIYYLKNTISGKYSKSWWIESVKKFEELHKNNPFDIIHSQSAGAYSLLMSGLNRQYNVPVVITFHGFSYDEIGTLLWSNLSLRHPHRSLKTISAILQDLYALVFRDMGFVRRADAIIAINESERQGIEKVLFPSKKPIFLIYNGIDTNFFSPANNRSIREAYGIRNNEILLLSVSRLTEVKGVQYLIGALPSLLGGHSIKLVIVGTGNYRNYLGTMVMKLKLSANVIFADFVPDEDIVAFYTSCDVFINPTTFEITPLTTIEAMACQKAVIASRVGAMPRLIDDGKDGILVRPRDVVALAKTIDHVLSKPKLMTNLGRNAREKVLREFSSEFMCEEVIRVYEHAISKTVGTR